jgi:hypothetical protein
MYIFGSLISGTHPASIISWLLGVCEELKRSTEMKTPYSFTGKWALINFCTISDESWLDVTKITVVLRLYFTSTTKNNSSFRISYLPADNTSYIIAWCVAAMQAFRIAARQHIRFPRQLRNYSQTNITETADRVLLVRPDDVKWLMTRVGFTNKTLWGRVRSQSVCTIRVCSVDHNWTVVFTMGPDGAISKWLQVGEYYDESVFI